MNSEDFQRIAEQWEAAFDAPYIGCAELWDYGKRIGLAVFIEDDKVWESRDNLAGPMKNPEVLNRYIRIAKSALPPYHPH